MTARILATLVLASSLPAIAQTLPYAAPGENLGAVNCASSLCHGAVSPWKDAHILQNEYVTWSRVDKHATMAYQVLFNDRSKRIVANLSVTDTQKTSLGLNIRPAHPTPVPPPATRPVLSVISSVGRTVRGLGHTWRLRPSAWRLMSTHLSHAAVRATGGRFDAGVSSPCRVA